MGEMSEPGTARSSNLPVHVIAALDRTASSCADGPAMRHKQGGKWRTTTWSEYRTAVRRAACGFIDLGLQPGCGVAILGFNRPEWFVSELAAIASGGLPAGIYTTSTLEQTRYVAEHCEASIAVVENAELLERMLAVRERLPGLETIVLMEGEAIADGVVTWADLLERGGNRGSEELDRRLADLNLDSPATLIYTSGTTGPPKAVMLSHRNILWTALTVTDLLDFDSSYQLLSYLPLSHIAEKMVSLYSPLCTGATVWFAESLEKVQQNLGEVRPHAFLGVPRVWEKIQAAMEAAGARSGALRKRLVQWARRSGLAGGVADQRGEPRPWTYRLADRLVFTKVRAQLGLDRASYCASAAAPISTHTLEFFRSLGIPILELYGMSECSGPATISLPDRYRLGKAGFPIPGTELRIADRGEVWMRGPHVFLGYYKDAEATAEALDGDGWLHSGDVGEIDDEGFLQITDRLKDLIITAGAKNVAPQLIESKLKAIPGVALAAVIGDRRNYLSALLTLDPEAVAATAEEIGSPARGPEDAASCERFRRYLEEQVERVNATLARYETIKRFVVLPGQFTTDGGELTPTMKLKRRVIAETYAAEIESLYAD